MKNEEGLKLEELKNKFIVDRKRYDKEKLPSFVERILRYCVISPDGHVQIQNQSLSTKEKIGVCILARFLASELDGSIKKDMTSTEIAETLALDRQIVFARINELTGEGLTESAMKGVYEIIPYSIEIFLNRLDERYNTKKSEKKIPQTIKIKKNNIRTKPVFDSEFLEKIEKLDKSNYIYITSLNTTLLKVLGILNIARKEFDSEWLTSPEIQKVLSEKFRIKSNIPAISMALLNLDRKASVESRRRKEANITIKEYRIMSKGEEELNSNIMEEK
jgi:hypothetical protein